VRTVRSAARARNQPRGHLALAVVAMLILFLSVLVARADAAPGDDDTDERDDRSEGWSGDDASEVTNRPRPRLYVPLTSAMVERVVTLAPPIALVIGAAHRVAGLADDPTTSWRRRSRMASLVPSISVRVGQNQSWRDVSDPTISHGVGVDVRASWQLDGLLFDSNEPRIATLDIARRRERRRLAAHVVRLYFDWVAARAAAERDVSAVLDAAAKAAELDALTDGWFSQALAHDAELR
jgi:hypothetical protein